MPIATTNPATGEVLKTFDPLPDDEIDRRIGRSVAGFAALSGTSLTGVAFPVVTSATTSLRNTFAPSFETWISMYTTRRPSGESLPMTDSAFPSVTALCSVPSRFINFPDEGHWVLKAANSRYWHEAVFGWLRRYLT